MTRVLTSSLVELELPLPVSALDPLTFVERDGVAGAGGAGSVFHSSAQGDESRSDRGFEVRIN